MATALITGIAGFAGSHLAELLLAKGYRVAGVELSLENTANITHIQDRLDLHACDLRDAARVEEVLSSVEPDELYHLAAIAHVPTSYRGVRHTFDVNLYGTLNILEAVRNENGNTKVLFVGTASEYGAVKDSELPTHEDVLLRPVNPYGVSKAAADMLAYQYHRNYGLHVVRVRPFNHVGPRQSPDYVVASLARQIAEIEKGMREPVISVGNLEAKRDLTDVRDIVLAYWQALQHGRPGEVYNICSEKALSVRQILEELVAMATRDISLRQDPDRMRPSDVPIVLGDCSRFRAQTGWKATTPLAATLWDTLAYWRGQSAGGALHSGAGG